MDVFEAIYNRHSQKKVRQDAVPRELIEKCGSSSTESLQSATLAIRCIDRRSSGQIG